jgi:hypothetical protein
MCRTIFAWVLFLGGFGIEIGIDRHLRMRDGDVHTGGIPEPLWFFIPIVLAFISAVMAWQGTRSLQGLWKRTVILTFQLLIGFLLYAFIGLWYVVGTGIDSL